MKTTLYKDGQPFQIEEQFVDNLIKQNSKKYSLTAPKDEEKQTVDTVKTVPDQQKKDEPNNTPKIIGKSK